MNDLEQFSEERLKELLVVAETIHISVGLFNIKEIIPILRIALAAKQAKPFAYYANDAYYNTERAALKDGAEEVTTLYTTPQPAHTEQNGWIKCSERMPDSKNDVQLFCSDTREQFVGFHRGNGMFQFFNMNDVIGECEPTHWMPLPAAPKPESEL